jgi:hypothetical protein
MFFSLDGKEPKDHCELKGSCGIRASTDLAIASGQFAGDARHRHY